jgi:hypothetical protein
MLAYESAHISILCIYPEHNVFITLNFSTSSVSRSASSSVMVALKIAVITVINSCSYKPST